MLTNTDLMLTTHAGANNKFAEEHQAHSLFEKAQRRAAHKRMFAFLTGRCACLLSLSQAVGSHNPANRHYLACGRSPSARSAALKAAPLTLTPASVH